MDRKAMIAACPLRTLEADAGGFPGRGELGIVVARHGAGKSSVLVGIAIDALLSGRRVHHVSLEANVERVREYYEQIFNELAREHDLAETETVHVEMERRRRIHSYLGGSFSIEKLDGAISFMREHASFDPDVIVVDGFCQDDSEAKDVEAMLGIARSYQAALWMTAVSHREVEVTDPDGVPEPVAGFKQAARLIVDLQTGPGGVKLRLLRPAPAEGDGLLPFVLDPTRMVLRQASAS